MLFSCWIFFRVFASGLSSRLGIQKAIGFQGLIACAIMLRILTALILYRCLLCCRVTAESSNNRTFTWVELLVIIAILLYGSVEFLFPVISRVNSMNHNNFDVKRGRLRIGLFGIDGVVFGI